VKLLCIGTFICWFVLDRWAFPRQRRNLPVASIWKGVAGEEYASFNLTQCFQSFLPILHLITSKTLIGRRLALHAIICKKSTLFLFPAKKLTTPVGLNKLWTQNTVSRSQCPPPLKIKFPPMRSCGWSTYQFHCLAPLPARCRARGSALPNAMFVHHLLVCIARLARNQPRVLPCFAVRRRQKLFTPFRQTCTLAKCVDASRWFLCCRLFSSAYFGVIPPGVSFTFLRNAFIFSTWPTGRRQINLQRSGVCGAEKWIANLSMSFPPRPNISPKYKHVPISLASAFADRHPRSSFSVAAIISATNKLQFSRPWHLIAASWLVVQLCFSELFCFKLRAQEKVTQPSSTLVLRALKRFMEMPGFGRDRVSGFHENNGSCHLKVNVFTCFC